MARIGDLELQPGQCWRYGAPSGFETSRLVIGAIATFSADAHIVCVSVSGAPQVQPDGTVVAVDIPFLPMSAEAFCATVEGADETPTAGLDRGFADALGEWSDDPRGASCFTVAFDGYLDRLIARQMAAIVGADADAA
ncbi:MAG: hypothetical protein ACK4MF_01750 [Hyphomicrobiaceae bacterium]